ncbi:MAG: hypothetical protein GY732_23950 [Gammaproteobacteria bacterium]|nr:hypothetical protein [Gammaproteobacteria bacterium]
MIDKTGFSIETQVDPHTEFEKLPDWVAFDLCKAYLAPGGNYLLHNTRNNKRAMVMPEVYASLLRCDQFQTITRHTANIVESNPGMKDQQKTINQVLQQMLDTGMMVSAKKVCEKLKARVDTGAEDREFSAPVVAIITWERPQALERLLESVVVNCDTTKVHRLYVIDDSRKAENISKNQDLVETYSSRVETPLEYFGQDEQQALLDDLSKRLPEHEGAIHFLADQSRWRDHWTSGLNRNLALLVSCGHRLVMMDDDTICNVYDPPQPKPNITFSDDPREADFFASEQDWAHLHQPINPDPVSRHMQCLGLPFSEAVAVLGQGNLKPAGLSNATALQISELEPDSRVLMTECGSLGCPGTTSNTWLPNMADNSLRLMLKSGQKTTNALTKRKVWSGRNHPHFAPRPNMSQITGFDNRHMLPPYLPIMRAEDRLFGYMLDFIFPSAVTLDYAWAVPHLPLPEREWQNKDLNFTPSGSFPSFFFEMILKKKSSCLSDLPTDRLANLSAWFKEMSTASSKSLSDIYRDTRLRDDSDLFEQLNGLLNANESDPVNWQNYLRNGSKELNRDMEVASRPDFAVKGMPKGMEGEELIGFWRDVWAGFADTLNAWPEIRQAATDILQAKKAPE